MAAVLLLALGAGVGAGVTIATRPSAARSIISSLPGGTSSSPSSGGSSSPAPLPTTPPQSSGSGASLDPSTIAQNVDPAVVDITVKVGTQGTAAGTGMVLTSSGEVLTNNHVVEGATSVAVQVAGTGPRYSATVIGVDPTDDVALLQLSGASGLKTVSVGNPSSLSVGDSVVALGNALGRGGTPAVTTGQITGLDQTITASDASGANPETLTGMIQVRANIQPGDSGGPMLDSSGRVVGMTTAGSARARRSGTIGFAIPIDKALSVARQIQSGSGPNVQAGQRGILGVEIDSQGGATPGAAVAQVQAGSPAEKAGIQAGDTITGVDGSSVDSADALATRLKGHKPGDGVSVAWVDQSGQRHTARITLTAGPPA